MQPRPSTTDLTAVASFFGLTSQGRDAIADRLTLRELPAGERLIRQGDVGDAMYFLVEGRVDVRVDVDGTETVLAQLEAPQPIGEIQLLTGGNRTASVDTASAVRLLVLSSEELATMESAGTEVYQRLLDVIRDRQRHLHVLSALANIFDGLPRDTLEQVAAQSRSLRLGRGEVLFSEGDPGSAWYLVLTGALEVLQRDRSGTPSLVNRLGRGDSFGETALLANMPRTATIRATRETELVEISGSAFAELYRLFPSFLPSMVRTLIGHMVSKADTAALNLMQTFVVAPVTESAPGREFAHALADALAALGETERLDPQRVQSELQIPERALVEPNHPAAMRLRFFVDALADRCEYLVLLDDARYPAWSEFCSAVVDEHILLAEASAEHSGPAVEGRTTLVLLQSHEGRPSGTRAWLDATNADQHLHVRWPPPTPDVARVARTITDHAVSVVLGGGGARGLAHLGVLQALVERGVPIDRLGGTSMGAAIAAQFAMGWSFDELMALNNGHIDMKPFRDFTIPEVALLASKKIDKMVYKTFGDAGIEDLWLPYFCVTADLTAAKAVIHERGSLWRAVRASGSLPLIVTPLIDEGHLLIDGGVLNNVPADIMRARSKGPMIVVNVSPEAELATGLDAIPSASSMFMSRLFPWLTRPDVPGFMDILVRTMVLAGVNKIPEAAGLADLFLEPPVLDFRSLQFDAIDALVRLGYEHMMEQLAAQWPDGPKLAER